MPNTSVHYSTKRRISGLACSLRAPSSYATTNTSVVAPHLAGSAARPYAHQLHPRPCPARSVRAPHTHHQRPWHLVLLYTFCGLSSLKHHALTRYLQTTSKTRCKMCSLMRVGKAAAARHYLLFPTCRPTFPWPVLPSAVNVSTGSSSRLPLLSLQLSTAPPSVNQTSPRVGLVVGSCLLQVPSTGRAYALPLSTYSPS